MPWLLRQKLRLKTSEEDTVEADTVEADTVDTEVTMDIHHTATAAIMAAEAAQLLDSLSSLVSCAASCVLELASAKDTTEITMRF